MLKLVFKCSVVGLHDDAEMARLQQSIGRRCKARRVDGFMVATAGGFFGCLEGESRNVLALVETLIRLPEIAGVTVLSETEVRGATWRRWREDLKHPDDLRRDGALAEADLAELAVFPVEPTHVGGLRPEV